ncbi:hypothetical protein CNMCM7691_008403 [Aspergillus felis]|uniref:Nucleoside phosphorylase domain-containing protein n=1 Tax=Aspergillus felis TaxID=1287682 RepID=A0A8H6V6C2_9EURO|nr:hypothetical protein CNMCM7691_008403 [Aspergillus felis]
MAAVPTPLLKPHDYTVAWICALAIEMAAAEAMLDGRHPALPTVPGDDNTYIAGRVGSHNVLIVCLPAGVYGTTSAANVASQMRLTFKGIRFGLMVGIAGGVPSADHDIRLGDVVVSKPTRDSGGVIQYDYGKAVSGGHLERTGVLNKPPTMLLTAVTALQSAHIADKSRIPDLIADLAERRPRMREKFTYDSRREDLLFEAQYNHIGPAITCNGCDRHRLVTRAPRDGNDPVIHYGLIASGNQVIKDGWTRDRLARGLGILCFEMEAAGLVDTFPCLVIRGICDYADSHKNKQWQEYAAATAAGYAKELLSMVHAVHVADTVNLSSPPTKVPVVHSSKALSKSWRSSTWLTWQHGDLDEALFRRISAYEHEKVHRQLAHKRVVGTVQWFLDHPDFKAWLEEKKFSRLWCSGKIGSGKTMIASAAIDAAKYRLKEHSAPTVFFYCERERPDELNGSYILSSLIEQLCGYLRAKDRGYPNDVADALNRFFGKNRVIPDFDDLKDVFIQLFYHIPDTVYIIDGLDALNLDQSKDLFELFRFLFCGSGSASESRILVFSREQLPGYTGIPLFMAGIHRISTTLNLTPDLQILRNRKAYSIREESCGVYGLNLAWRYQVQIFPGEFFVVGRVFAIVWHEGRGQQGTVISDFISQGKSTQGQFTRGRVVRMVVVRAASECAWCLPITTYSGQGVTEPGIDPAKHAIVYMRGSTPTRRANEPQMIKEPLEVEPARPDEKLDLMSRLNFGKVYTVEYNAKVRPIGMISWSSMAKFRVYASNEFRLDI